MSEWMNDFSVQQVLCMCTAWLGVIVLWCSRDIEHKLDKLAALKERP